MTDELRPLTRDVLDCIADAMRSHYAPPRRFVVSPATARWLKENDLDPHEIALEGVKRLMMQHGDTRRTYDGTQEDWGDVSA